MFCLFQFLSLGIVIGLCEAQCDARENGGSLKCCDGKDDACVGTHHGNGLSRYLLPKCFCDAHCVFTGDCCPDYERVVLECKKPVDCVAVEWSGWTPCSHTCG